MHEAETSVGRRSNKVQPRRQPACWAEPTAPGPTAQQGGAAARTEERRRVLGRLVVLHQRRVRQLAVELRRVGVVGGRQRAVALPALRGKVRLGCSTQGGLKVSDAAHRRPARGANARKRSRALSDAAIKVACERWCAHRRRGSQRICRSRAAEGGDRRTCSPCGPCRTRRCCSPAPQPERASAV